MPCRRRRHAGPIIEQSPSYHDMTSPPFRVIYRASAQIDAARRRRYDAVTVVMAPQPPHFISSFLRALAS